MILKLEWLGALACNTLMLSMNWVLMGASIAMKAACN